MRLVEVVRRMRERPGVAADAGVDRDRLVAARIVVPDRIATGRPRRLPRMPIRRRSIVDDHARTRLWPPLRPPTRRVVVRRRRTRVGRRAVGSAAARRARRIAGAGRRARRPRLGRKTRGKAVRGRAVGGAAERHDGRIAGAGRGVWRPRLRRKAGGKAVRGVARIGIARDRRQRRRWLVGHPVGGLLIADRPRRPGLPGTPDRVAGAVRAGTDMDDVEGVESCHGTCCHQRRKHQSTRARWCRERPAPPAENRGFAGHGSL